MTCVWPRIMGVGTERGGVNSPSWADQQQQQQQPPQQQQQHQLPWGPSPRAMHAWEVYRACVAAGQQARFTVEQRPEGEFFSLSSRPFPPAATATSVAAAGGRRYSRKPNQKRAERLRARRESRRSITAARLQQLPKGKRSASDLQQHRQQQATASSRQQATASSRQQATASSRQQATASSRCTVPPTDAAADRGPLLQPVQPATTPAAQAAAGTPARSTHHTHQQQQQQHSSTRETRASKRRKTWSSPGNDAVPQQNDAPPSTPATPGGIPQIDGEVSEPGTPYRDPPTPPPMSPHFPRHPYKVLCKLCVQKSHYLTYAQCEFCHYSLMLKKV